MKRATALGALAMWVVVFPTLLIAGREEEYSDKYPHLTFIGAYGKSTWFAGFWSGRFLAVQYDSMQRWETFPWTIPGDFSPYDLRIEQHGHWLIFSGNNRNFYFDMLTVQWTVERPKGVPSPDSGHVRPEPFRIDRNAVVVEKAGKETRYELPTPSYCAYRRWREPPQPSDWIENEIGSHVQIGNSVWFAVDFYDGEGCTGIGGLGVFDLQTKEFGVFRHPFLADCSTGIFIRRGDTLFIATGSNSEYGQYGCNGLVVIDSKTGKIARIDSHNSPLDGDYFFGMNLVGDRLWMLTVRAIVGWNLQEGTWVSARCESMMTTDTTTYYREALALGISSNGGILEVKGSQVVPMGQIERGQTIGYLWPNWNLVEVQLSDTIVGWMARADFFSRENLTNDGLVYNTLKGLLYKDTSLALPFHHIGLGPCKKIAESGNAVKVSAHSFYVDPKKLQPVFSEQGAATGFLPPWHDAMFSPGEMKEYAIREFRREQKEIRDNIPVYDTLLTINKRMELYDFHTLVDCRWLPAGRFEPTQPTGIVFTFFGPGEGGERKRLALEIHSDSLWNGNRQVAKGDTMVVAGNTFKARFIVAGFNISDGILDDIVVHYTLWISSPPRWED